MRIPMTDLTAIHPSIQVEIKNAIERVRTSGNYILGAEVKTFEANVAKYLGCQYAVGVANGTEALWLAILACGIKPGDEVITSPFTFMATAEVITQCGGVPVFVDIDPFTYCIDAAKIEAKITPKTKGIIPVHLYGHPCDMDKIMGIAMKHKLWVVEDCAQSMGSKYRGQNTGTIGHAGCLSFFPSKILGAMGDGGMVVTDIPEVAHKIEMLRNHGCETKYLHLIPGFNSRLDALQAAVLDVKLKFLEVWITQRRYNAKLYNMALQDTAIIPTEMEWGTHVYNYYTIQVENRDWLPTHLKAKEIDTQVYYPLSLNLQPVYKNLNQKDCPISENAQKHVISLPMYPELTHAQIKFVTDAVKEYILK